MPPERDLFANFERMRREIDELFGDVFERSRIGPVRRGFTPEVDVYYCGGQRPLAVVKADLAGVAIEDVGIEIRGRELVIAGERRPQDAEGRLYQQIEIAHGPFRRVVELGTDVIADEASATYDDGILRVEIPIATEDPRQIQIRSRERGDAT
jgi:HSP20 family protein